ncbi:universal stress protein UspA [Salinigranum rubrum]|uniref:Universal stress protein UspA n=1 Tax=Salinigranum rubrum TaxID=755307 RepID=A0A2I8VGB7_9EURY|nr:universal stress protein [Salinigranum rubrum]AUV80975.1 universal stress protein UspA [Salinigranum rubrum]
MGRTLVALDDSPQAQNALAYALSVHERDEFVLLHVIDYSESITDPGRGGRGRLEGWYQKATEDAEDLFEEATALTDDYDVSVTTVVADGKPAQEIIDCADDHDVDQIVMGSHGRTGVARILLGSVAEQVVRRSERPTTVVH